MMAIQRERMTEQGVWGVQHSPLRNKCQEKIHGVSYTIILTVLEAMAILRLVFLKRSPSQEVTVNDMKRVANSTGGTT